MQKLMLKHIITIAALTYCLSIPAKAQSIFDFGSKKTSPQAATTTPSPVMSADQFKNAVKAKSEATQNTISQQATQQFIKQPPLPAKQPPVPMDNTSSSSALEQAPVSEAPKTQQPATLPPLPSAPQPTYPPPTAGGSQATPYAPPPPVAPSTQPYTGFGTGDQNKTPAPQQPAGNSGGWNIKY